jgi:hypothetical protein
VRDAMDKIEGRLSTDVRFTSEIVTRPHPLLVFVVREELGVLFAPAIVWDRGRDLLKPYAARFAASAVLVFILGSLRDPDIDQALSRGLGGILSEDPTSDELFVASQRAFELLDAKRRAERRGQWVSRYQFELGELVDIARAMTTERDVDKLLGVILEKSRFVTGADAGSIYVVEGDDPHRLLRFKFTQNDSVTFDSREFVMPMNSRSIAGSAAIEKRPVSIDDVYDLPAGSPFAFDRRFDELTHYRTKSMLVAPLISQRDEAPRQEALRKRRRRRRGHPFRRAERRALGHGRCAGRRVARECASVRRNPAPLRRFRQGERRGDRVARSDDERALASRSGSHARLGAPG